MEVEFDPEKDRLNRAKHGISLARAAELEELTIEPDERFPYTEDRYRSWGYIDGALYCLAFTFRNKKVVRAISLRRAHRKEVSKHVSTENR
jgi:uncharacterized DUF497 family protein